MNYEKEILRVMKRLEETVDRMKNEKVNENEPFHLRIKERLKELEK